MLDHAGGCQKIVWLVLGLGGSGLVGCGVLVMFGAFGKFWLKLFLVVVGVSL